MAETHPEPTPAPEIERGAYEVIRDRLLGQGKVLAEKANALNAARLSLFGRTELALLGTERIRTENSCLARDVIQVGGQMLFGYNVHLGLRTETRVEDVFSLHRILPKDASLALEEIRSGPERAFLEEPAFVRDFKELYQYYSGARLLQLRNLGGKLLAVFQIGGKVDDIKVFRWSVTPQGEVSYIDNRGERDHVYPPSHDFVFSATGRDQHVYGRHPHVSILDQVFVETVGGDLTVKVENNTEDGLGIYREPVDDPKQSLDDAEIHYAKVGSLVLLKVLPFRERTYRYLVFNGLTRRVVRIDAIGQACVSLPEDHGIVFPGGFHLQTGETKLFDGDFGGLELKRVLRSPNGEDVLYVFHHRAEGRSVLFAYNLIRKEVASPVTCHGLSRFDDGKLVILRATSGEPTRVHQLQVWQTPFCSEEHAAAAPSTGGYLEKIGNAELVRGISDCLSLVRLVESQEPTRAVYEDLIASSIRTLDSYHWLVHPEASGLAETVQAIRQTAELVIDEFDKVEAIRKTSRDALRRSEVEVADLLDAQHPDDWTSVPPFVEALAELRRRQGHLITQRELRYVDRARLDALEARVVERFEVISQKAVAFLLGQEAFAPFHAQVAEVEARLSSVTSVHDTEPLAAELGSQVENLELLAEIIGSLKIDDATQRTLILERLSEVLAALNRVRALVLSRRKELLSVEVAAEFGVQFRLLGQSVTSALSVADTPDKCDAALSRLMVQVEDLEGRFGELEELQAQLATKREEIYEAVTARKQTLVDQRQRRAEGLMEAASRILAGVVRRAGGLADEDALNAYFAGDPMVAKLRDLCDALRELGSSVRAEEVETRLKAARQDAARAQRDRSDLFEGDAVIRLGRHRFGVNTQPLELTLVPRGDGLALHLTGTDFHEPLEDEGFAATRDFWSQDLVSETDEVYRGEYLAATLLAAAEQEQDGLSLERLREAAHTGEGLVELVRQQASARYDEGYERGVHDVDAAAILARLLALHKTAGLLRFEPRARSLAMLFWAHFEAPEPRASWLRRARSLGRLRAALSHTPAIFTLSGELAEQVAAFFAELGVPVDAEDARVAGAYLFEELSREPLRFEASADAVRLRKAFLDHLAADGSARELERDVQGLAGDLASLLPLVSAWVTAFVDQVGQRRPEVLALRPAVPGAIALVLVEGRLDYDQTSAQSQVVVEGLVGQHPRIRARSMELRLDEFLSRLGRFRNRRVPGFRAYQKRRHTLLEAQRRRLRLSELEPRVMSAFVRNKLIDQVYLPLIGDNLAKQIGALGQGKRTDLMGLLLLISPPGYGKTTLMEYVAHRLGLVFVKVNGPALGHAVTSLDPAEVKSATARREVERLNLAFEMASNVLLYLDDIQHTHPELLQKFISLCDAQRKIEGVWRGETRTYDLRGRRFVVCMAGNPYTESGEKFRIPDMLANRADIYNLGDILTGKDALFALSYVENALTSNPVLAPLTTRGLDDVYRLAGMAAGDGSTPDQLAHDYSAPELEEVLAVLRRLFRCREVLLRVNQQYILSASQQDAFRTEPAFQLQGSYRNMNALAEKVVSAMNDAELEALIDDHYLGEAQTLTTGAEHNLLKLAELRGRMSEEQRTRWEQIKRGFVRVQAMGGAETDPVVKVTGQLGLMSDRLAEIGEHIARAAHGAAATDPGQMASALARAMETLQAGLQASETSASGGLSSEAVTAIAERLTDLSRQLAGIGQAIDGAATAAATAKPGAPDMAPHLARLETAMATLATQRGTRREVIQALPSGVQDLLGEMTQQVSDALMPAIRGLARRLEGSDDPADRRIRDQLSSTLKKLDQLQDLASALGKLDTRGLGTNDGR